MAHWNHRVMRKVTSEADVGLEDSVEYGIHEVYCDAAGGVATYWSHYPVEVVAETPGGVSAELARMVRATTLPVLSAETGRPVDE